MQGNVNSLKGLPEVLISFCVTLSLTQFSDSVFVYRITEVTIGGLILRARECVSVVEAVQIRGWTTG